MANPLIHTIDTNFCKYKQGLRIVQQWLQRSWCTYRHRVVHLWRKHLALN